MGHVGHGGKSATDCHLYALVASRQHQSHVLIVHQNALELFTSLSLIAIHATRLCNVHLSGSAGYWLCAMILSDSLSWWGTIASAINLAVITVERYLRVVHPVWSKNKLRNRAIYLAMATAWIISFATNIAVVFPTK